MAGLLRLAAGSSIGIWGVPPITKHSAGMSGPGIKQSAMRKAVAYDGIAL